ncbi:MAG: OmpA family protein [Porticoccaceae bacterium]|jgi:peptidoglycan-associated lipoprotein|nr:OmpA family protein [Porticoccaceae bacterium]
MKAKLHILIIGMLAVFLAACQSTSTMDDEGGMADDASAPAVAEPVVVETVPTTPTLRDDQTYIGGTSMANGGAMVAEDDVVLYFGFDQSTLTPQSRAALTRIAAALRTSTGNVRLEGHADERGSREYNIALGERRANAVSDFLVLQGVSASRLETISYGEERPAVNGTGDRVWSQNRRVEIK